jgi:hypothetical protein
VQDDDLEYVLDTMESLSLSPTDVGCYEHLNQEQNERFLRYEVIVGGYCNVAVALVGFVGNLLSLVVLFRKEMRQKNNCFNSLLIGKSRDTFRDSERRVHNTTRVP